MSNITYNQYGYRIGPAIRLAEEGYTIEDLEVFNDPVVPAFTRGLADSADYFKIPGRLRMWSAREKYYGSIALTTLFPVYSMLQFTPNPYRGSFINLVSRLVGITWDTSYYDDPVSCVIPTEYPRGFLRPPIPVIHFIVDTASNVQPAKIRRTSFAAGSDCLVIEEDDDTFTIDLAENLLDIVNFLDVSTSMTLEEVGSSATGCGKYYKLKFGAPSCASDEKGALVIMHKDTYGEGTFEYVCPPDDDGKKYALTCTNGAYSWMLIESCEEATPSA